MAKDITNDITTFNADDKKTSNGDRAEKIRTILCDVVQDHAYLKQLSTILAGDI